MMTKFVSKPQEIEAVQFFPHESVWPKNVHKNGSHYSVFNKAHASYIAVHPSDWIREDNQNDVYPITDDYIKEHYERKS